MKRQGWLLFAGRTPGASDSEAVAMIRLSVAHWLENATDEDIMRGFVEFPEGEGELFCLPAVRLDAQEV